MSAFLSRFQQLSAAEEFLTFLDIPHEASVVSVKRLHILKRFHDYIGKAAIPADAPDDVLRDTYRDLLARAYGDFVTSDAQTEKVFKVFHREQPGRAFVPLTAIKRGA